MSTPNVTTSPVLNLFEAAEYVRRTPKALRSLRERRGGPDSFRAGGRVMYRIAALDAWLAANEAADSRSNRDLDPTQRAAEPRRATGRRLASA
jgi:hypothetical protein